MRGCSEGAKALKEMGVVFPAYAGMFLARNHRMGFMVSFPRVCGDVPNIARINFDRFTFSPRMRGCSDTGKITKIIIKVFPAYAGMFRARRWPESPCGGFPRVCGDVPLIKQHVPRLVQFSLRMRGCSGKGYVRAHARGVFPAYAGMFRPRGW